ncbi:MAG: hypothetical protein WBM45_09890 [Woeseiaceae bacterium]|jgi:hypothetical protein
MTDTKSTPRMPDNVAAIVAAGYATWANREGDVAFRKRFDAKRIPVTGVRNVRVWGLQVDDERELPGLERTSIPDDEIWEINLEAADGSHYEVNSTMLKAAE